MKYLLLLFGCFSLTVFSQIPEDPEIPSELVNHPIFIPEGEIIDLCGCGAEVHYAGGYQEIQAFIQGNFQFPEGVNFSNLDKHKMYVEFVVNEDGAVSDVIIHRGIDDKVNQEIIRVIERLPNWIPDEYHCRSVKSRLRFPLTLTIL